MAIVTFGKEKFFHLGMTPEEVKEALHGKKPSETRYWAKDTVTIPDGMDGVEFEDDVLNAQSIIRAKK